MRYKVFFTTGETVLITKNGYDFLKEAMVYRVTPSVMVDDVIFSLQYITHVAPEDLYEETGTIVRPQTPENVAEQKKREEEAIKADPDKIIERVKEAV